MGSCCKLFSCIFIVIVAVQVFTVWKFFQIPPIPEIPTDDWYGKGNRPDQIDESVRNFSIKFDQEMIDVLQSKLNESDYFTEPLEGIGFEYGFNNKYLQEVVTFWKTRYNFAGREKFLNQFPHYKTNIQGLDIHFLHVKPRKSENLKVVPLLLLHGWPGSVAEFYRLIPYLIFPRVGRSYVFELIVPSLPGFGYSDASLKPGFGEMETTVVMKNLMERLGFKRFIVQGGDWGAAIGHNMAILFPENVIGFHTNFPPVYNTMGIMHYLSGIIYPGFVLEERYYNHMYPLSKLVQFVLEETGYMHIQATKPDTIGVALRDSPVGLAAYILEKFSTWTNRDYRKLKDGGLTLKFTMTELLDNVMIYWHSKCITTSMRMYAGSFNKKAYKMRLDEIPIDVPTAVMRNEHEIMYSSEKQLHSKLTRMVQLTEYADVGHFAAMELPDEMSADIWDAAGEFLSIEYISGKSKNEL